MLQGHLLGLEPLSDAWYIFVLIGIFMLLSGLSLLFYGSFRASFGIALLGRSVTSAW